MEASNTPQEAKKPRKSPVTRIVKWVAWTAGIVIALVVAVLAAAVWILSPDRLTRIIENAANENLAADVTLKRAELTVWSTFPYLNVKVDSLTVRSRGFDRLSPEERAALPADADTLVSVASLQGGLNLLYLPAGQIRLTDILLDNPKVNIVQYNDTIYNYDIAQPSDEKTSDEAVSLPDITLNRFDLAGEFPIRYFSAADSTDALIVLSQAPVLTQEEAAKGYHMTLKSDINGILPDDLRLDSLAFALNGKVEWKHDHPTLLTLTDFDIAVNEVKSRLNTRLDFADPLTVESFDITLGPVTPGQILDVLPPSLKKDIKPVKTDMEATLTARLTKPYAIDSKGYPWLTATLDIPETDVTYDKYTVKDLTVAAEADINGDDLDASTVKLTTLHGSMDGAVLDASATATRLLTDPYVDCKIKANANLQQLPAALRAEIPGTVKGKVALDTKARLRKSDLSPKGFHRILAEGTLSLDGIDVNLQELNSLLYTRHTQFTFGTNSHYINGGAKVDSLLTASIKADTIAMLMGGYNLHARDLKMGVGCANRKNSADTTAINPIGGAFSVASLTYNDDDSMLVKLRNVTAHAALRRFNNEAREPLLDVSLSAKRAFYADKFNRVALFDTHFSTNAHLRAKPKVSKRIKMLYDSIAAANPGLSTDSIVQIMQKSRRSRRDINLSQYEMLDFGVDGDTKKLLQRWDVSGQFKADRGVMFTPYFPLRNRLSNLNVTFSTDSVVFNNVEYRAGHSSVVLNGSMRNIRRALISSRPIRLNLKLNSDTLNVNEVLQAVYKGSAFAEKVTQGDVQLSAVDSEKAIENLIDSAAMSGETAALLVPMNINADIRVNANTIVYSDLIMNDFQGELFVNNGAINLNELSASSDIGSALFTALYTAPTKKDIRFGFGLTLKDIHVKEFINMMPAVDSLMPLLNSFEGRINADVAATSNIDSLMNVDIPSLHAAIKLDGDSLTLLDAETFRTISKWLLFKDKRTNVIPHMTVEMLVQNSTLQMFPFVFDFDRYRLAVMGSNDLALNFKYHISVLKSPLPFKFGINVSGNADKMKVRLGGAKYKPGQAGETIAIVDTTRINLLREIDRVFRRGARNARLSDLRVQSKPQAIPEDAAADTIAAADSAIFIKEGLIAPPDTVAPSPATNPKEK